MLNICSFVKKLKWSIVIFVEKKETLTAEEWSVDQQMLSKLKEQYKRERHRDTKSGAVGSGHISDSKSSFVSASTPYIYDRHHKCLLNCSPAPHQSLTGGENQEDQKAAGCVVFSGTYISLHKRPGQRLTIAKDGERNSPLPTMRSDDDDR